MVVFGKEIFYGQGIDITLPGRSHVRLSACLGQQTLIMSMSPQHGQPHQQFDLGETALDEDTFNEYLAEMREHYTADKVSGVDVWAELNIDLTWQSSQYHLLGMFL